MLAIVHIGEKEFSASAWNGGELKLHLWQPMGGLQGLERARRMLGQRFEKVIWVGKPLRDTLARLSRFPWPEGWPEFRRFIVENPLALHSRASRLLSGEAYYYPADWLDDAASPRAHAKVLAEVLGLQAGSLGEEGSYCPFPSALEISAWRKQLGISTFETGAGRGLDWQAGSRTWIENSTRRPFTREENSALWEPRDLWRLFHAGGLAYAIVGSERISSPVRR